MDLGSKITIDRNNAKSLTTQLEEQFAALIKSGFWDDGSRLPAAKTLAEQFGVAYRTMETALQQLAKRGFIKRSTRGSFVKNKNMPVTDSRESSDFTIKIIVAQDQELTDHNYIDIYQGLLMRASELGINVQNIPFSDNCEISESFFGPNDFFFMFDSVGYEKRIIPELQRRNIQFVTHCAFEQVELGFNSIVVNVRTPTIRVVQELIKSGRSKIAFLHDAFRTEWRRASWPAPKLHGYRDAIEEAGLKYKLLEVPFNPPGDISKELDEYFKDEIPQAIFTMTDAMAWTVLDYLQKRNYRVPEDVAVIGFSNLPHSSDKNISLTSIDYPRAKIGRSAVDWMVHLKKFPEISPATKIVETEVFYRKSFPKPIN